MRLLDRFRRPDRVRESKRDKGDQRDAGATDGRREAEVKPLPSKIEPPPASSGKAAQQSLPNRASEEDAA